MGELYLNLGHNSPQNKMNKIKIRLIKYLFETIKMIWIVKYIFLSNSYYRNMSGHFTFEHFFIHIIVSDDFSVSSNVVFYAIILFN